MTGPRRRLADRLLNSGRALAQTYADADRLDPKRPTLGQLVAETLAEHERIGEERILARIRVLVEQRTALREERIAVAQRFLESRNLPPAASEFAWAAALDEQIGSLRLLLAGFPPADDETDLPDEQPAEEPL
jgi:hypothetical protein